MSERKTIIITFGMLTLVMASLAVAAMAMVHEVGGSATSKAPTAQKGKIKVIVCENTQGKRRGPCLIEFADGMRCLRDTSTRSSYHDCTGGIASQLGAGTGNADAQTSGES